MSYPYDSRTSLVEGACLTVSFLSSLGDGGVEVDNDGALVDYYPFGMPGISAEIIRRAVAVFDSRPVYLSSEVTSWHEVRWEGSNPVGTKTHVYVRTANSEAGLQDVEWRGPLLNKAGEDIEAETGKFIQFRIAMYSAYSSGAMSTPIVTSFSASCYVEGTSQRFYTSRMSLGFVPKHVVLTYNGEIPADTVIQFAVTTSDGVDLDEYKVITPNTVTALDDIATASFLKVAISALGNTKVPFVVDEFALAVGGDGDARLSG